MKAHQLELAMADLQRARDHAAKLEAEYEQMCQEAEQCQLEFDHVCEEYEHCCSKPTTEVVEREIEQPYTEYVEKKVRRKTTETPVANPQWEEQIKQELEVKLQQQKANVATRSQYSSNSGSPNRRGLRKEVPDVSPVRSVRRHNNEDIISGRSPSAQAVRSTKPVNKKK